MDRFWWYIVCTSFWLKFQYVVSVNKLVILVSFVWVFTFSFLWGCVSLCGSSMPVFTFLGVDFDVSRKTLFCNHYLFIVDIFWFVPVVVYSLNLGEVFPR